MSVNEYEGSEIPSVPTVRPINELAAVPVNLGTLAHFSTVQVPRIAADAAENVVTNRDRTRQVLEDSRANHRNLNRMLTLTFALVVGLFITYTLQQGYWGAYSHTLAPYSFVITVLLDSSLAAYSLIRKY